jgi:hypothetical protein
MPPLLEVQLEDGRTLQFTRPFLIGREPTCDVVIDNGRVSRRHVLVAFENGQWQLHDQQSGNGIIVAGRRVPSARVGERLSVRLGPEGPVVTLVPVTAAAAAGVAAPEGTAGYVPRPDAPVGSRTMFFQRTIARQRRTYRAMVGLLALVAAAAGAYAYYAHRKIAALEARAQDIFYRMKVVDTQNARAEEQLRKAGITRTDAQIRQYREERARLEREYEAYLDELGVYGTRMSEEDRLILRVTRRLGECEVAAPPQYVDEVRRYIRQWRSTSRFVDGVRLAKRNGYTQRIIDELDTVNLPRQFFYLALQESNFNEFAVGPPTSYGYAKGMWQFIRDTGARYGLRPGPFAAYARKDPLDERHQWEKATHAAALYLKDIYATDAQASALLVMASYNWGERRVIKRIKSMPQDPRERNFWKLLAKYPNDVPSQTYNYVLSIVSAAVIGENPRLFNIPIDNPLALDESRPAR